MPTKLWKTQPIYHALLEVLKKKGAMTDAELFEHLSEEFKDISYKDFNRALMMLEIGGKIRTTSLVRGKKRVELIA